MLMYISSKLNELQINEVKYHEHAVVSAINGYKKSKVPVDRLSKIYQVARWFKGVVKDVPAPQWCKVCGERYEILWIMVLILGFDGRLFSFARVAVAKAIGINSPMVIQQFIKLMIDHKIIRKAITGSAYGGKEKCGRPDEFEICDETAKSQLFHLGPRECSKYWSRKNLKSMLVKGLPWLDFEERLSEKASRKTLFQ